MNKPKRNEIFDLLLTNYPILFFILSVISIMGLTEIILIALYKFDLTIDQKHANVLYAIGCSVGSTAGRYSYLKRTLIEKNEKKA